ncbi:hypothetical protein DI396_00095 [Litorivita pollutaquae]|uniref:VPLPA-CTERM protein sorting domain-containing protein n=1 Tax=Litorivita pollutaquae TaxID=2200892 RepID=A0A2V4MYC0_9RHOB|nr:VPLPA-CTERM sorting domain-containing protein [Litorivita pollutaquae]OUS20978.1 hypothetical protein A9Q95_12165 [Rhodobacterales bacterium 59_46_T64]PYC49318.1 hypothetical protein DI396_00095 [Litorivita pollutaquae]
MRIRSIFLTTTTAAVLCAGSVSAATITNLVGDIDGFGGQTAAGAVGAETGFGFNNTTGSDPSFTDAWLYEQDGGAGGSPVDYTHSYALTGTALSATLSLMESGMSDGRGPWEVRFNGNLLGEIADGDVSTSTLHSFGVDVSWLTGSDVISLIYLDTSSEGYAIDYSMLSIETAPAVPLPAAGFLMIGALGALGFARKRR